MLTTVFVSVASTLCLLLGAGGAWALIASGKREPQTEPDWEPSEYLQQLSAKLAALEIMVHGLPSLWEEERERTLKHANRAYASEKRARELLAGDEDFDEDDDESQRLLELDALRSETSGVLPMHDGVANPIDADLQARANAVLGRGF